MSDADQVMAELDDFIIQEMTARHLMGLALMAAGPAQLRLAGGY